MYPVQPNDTEGSIPSGAQTPSMRGAATALILACAVAAGCLGPAPRTVLEPVADGAGRPLPGTDFTYALQAGAPTPPASEDTYWFVEVLGHESREGPYVQSCDRSSTFHVDRDRREVLFDPSSHPYDAPGVQTLVATDATVFSGCALAYGLQADQPSDDDLGLLGRVQVLIDDRTGEARVLLGTAEISLAPGQVLGLSGEGGVSEGWHRFRAASEMTVEHHGAWPRPGLRAVGHGAYW